MTEKNSLLGRYICCQEFSWDQFITKWKLEETLTEKDKLLQSRLRVKLHIALREYEYFIFKLKEKVIFQLIKLLNVKTHIVFYI